MSPKTTKREREAELARAAARRARRTPCPKCGRPTFYGLDADVLALTSRTATWSATAAEEVLAWSARRASFVVRETGRGPELDRRDRRHVVVSPGTSSWGGRVVLEHLCGEDPPRGDPAPCAPRYGPDDPPPY